jgi:uncharacterized membrane protein
MKRNILVFGLISGGLVGLFLIALSSWENSAGSSTGYLLGYASMIVALSLVYVGVRNFRDKYNDGIISFGKAFRIAMGIAAIASTIYVLVWLVEFYVFMPDFMDKYAAHEAAQARSAGLSAAALSKKLAEIEGLKTGYKNPVVVVLYSYAEILPVGIIISLITALLLKRKRRPAAAAAAIA